MDSSTMAQVSVAGKGITGLGHQLQSAECGGRGDRSEISEDASCERQP